jgi:hypothetical protein
MVKFFVLALMCALFGAGQLGAAQAEYQIIERHNNDGNRVYVTPGSDSEASCDPGGTSCYRLVLQDGPVGPCWDVAPGILLQAKISVLQGRHVNGVDSQTLSKSGFTFLPGEYDIRIVNCPSYPQYNGVTKSLAGVQLAQDGTFSVYFPPIP